LVVLNVIGMMLKLDLRNLDIGHRYGAAVRYEQNTGEKTRVTQRRMI